MIETERLVLRRWRSEDAGAIFDIGQSRDVMQFIGPLMSRDDATALVNGQILNQSLFGHCFWPIERRSGERVIGFCGLNPAPVNTPLQGAIEIGWRLAFDVWGQGYAREAAAACVEWAWDHTSTDRIAAMTVAANTRSWPLMERLGMQRRLGEDFDHPDLAADDPLRRQIVYTIDRPQ